MATSTIKVGTLNGTSKDTLPTNTNLNNVHTQGVYLLSGGNTYTNAPSTYGILEVVKPVNANDQFTLQRVTNLDHIYFRYSTSATAWGSWKTL